MDQQIPLQLLLISGPPGLGKTTLAHVVARHAGYEVMEINARSASAESSLAGSSRTVNPVMLGQGPL